MTLVLTVVAPSSFNLLLLENCELNCVTYVINHEICYEICDSQNNEYQIYALLKCSAL
jgi:hypothetical protein